MNRPTLREIATRLGVSIATVSYALNGRPGVGPELRTRIIELAAEMGYRPNDLAKGLRTGQTRSIGMLVEDLANPFSADLASAILSVAQARGFKVLVSHTRNAGRLEPGDFEALHDSGVEGVILASVVNYGDRELMETVVVRKPPVIQVIRHLPDLAADVVGIDDRAAARQAAMHLLQTGRTDVAVIAGPQWSPTSELRLAGFREALALAGQPLASTKLVVSGYSMAEGGRAAAQLARSDPPQAILCGNDLIALGAIDALLTLGLRVPEDIAVVGFDDISIAAINSLGLTTIRQPRTEIGEATLATLLRRIDGSSDPPVHVVVPHELIVRTSCGMALVTERSRR
ncbi:MAG: LacI family DNA-binding transcriptional regulator [Gaiellales bacterium]